VGAALGFAVTVAGVDARPERFPQARRVLADLKFDELAVTPNSYIVVASHGNYDEDALEWALGTEAAYVALVASPKRAAAVRAYLAESGLSEAQLGRLKAPAGLDLGAVTPEEIALSVLAEIVQARRRGTTGAVDETKDEPHEEMWGKGQMTKDGEPSGEHEHHDHGEHAPHPPEAHEYMSHEHHDRDAHAGHAHSAEAEPEHAGHAHHAPHPPEAHAHMSHAHHDHDAHAGHAQPAEPGTAIDPVCGMTVEMAGARYTAEHAGQTYYFCCPGVPPDVPKGTGQVRPGLRRSPHSASRIASRQRTSQGGVPVSGWRGQAEPPCGGINPPTTTGVQCRLADGAGRPSRPAAGSTRRLRLACGRLFRATAATARQPKTASPPSTT
jgi:xanthine dehydrogenase accessory factor